MKKKQKAPDHISYIKVYENRGYWIDLDGILLDKYLGRATNSVEFGGLAPALGLCNKSDQKKAVELVDQINVRFPVLVCGDDLDFSCIVVTVSVEEAGPYIVWRHFGYGLDGREPIQVKPLYFDRQNYGDFVRDFVRLSQECLYEME